jgi:hypothetical protein
MKKRTDTRPKLQKQSKRKSRKSKRIMPPVSRATGGLLPGVDLTRFSDYQEMEDLEYVERMKGLK